MEKTNTNVPFIVHEAAISRAERYNKRMCIALIIAIIFIFISNGCWLLFINQYNFESYDISTDGGGNANYIGKDGDIYNGTSKSA